MPESYIRRATARCIEAAYPPPRNGCRASRHPLAMTGDTFHLLGLALIIALMATLMLKKPGHLSGGGAH